MGALLATLGAIGASIAATVGTAFVDAAIAIGVAVPIYSSAGVALADAFTIAAGSTLWFGAAAEALEVVGYSISLATLGAIGAGGLAVGGGLTGLYYGISAIGNIGSGVAGVLPFAKSVFEIKKCNFYDTLYNGSSRDCKLRGQKLESVRMENRQTTNGSMQSAGANSGSKIFQQNLQSRQYRSSQANSMAKSTKRMR